MKSFICIFVSLSCSLIAGVGFAKRKHHAHEHGHAKLNIAVEASGEVAVEFEAPGDSVFGFEHEPKSAKEKKVRSDAMKVLKDTIGELVRFDAGLGCKVASASVEVEHEHGAKGSGSHNEVHAKYRFKCAKSVGGSKVMINFHDKFSKIEELDVQVLSAKGQSKVELDHAKGNVKLP